MSSDVSNWQFWRIATVAASPAAVSFLLGGFNQSLNLNKPTLNFRQSRFIDSKTVYRNEFEQPLSGITGTEATNLPSKSGETGQQDDAKKEHDLAVRAVR
ncbi:hypothetical protein NQ176_g8429 [Zarea fungicola]|uniref:Uncharacterized protein n=1 Tax=Zarea fungicola TaxID=93591 RepID=A0ACC1MT59_9HYPO|nr:hypothetical protein NQ176_g8429 [Lecanicillium fungicola]